MPLLTFYGNSLADRFPTHAEQFNQNINSQGFASANLTRRSLEIFQQYLAISLMFGIQAVDLRTYLIKGHYDASVCLSPQTRELYLAVLEVIGRSPSPDQPYVWNDLDLPLDEHIAKIVADIQAGGVIIQAANQTLFKAKS
jgi:phenylalanine ammonia-lyase